MLFLWVRIRDDECIKMKLVHAVLPGTEAAIAGTMLIFMCPRQALEKVRVESHSPQDTPSKVWD